MPRSRRCCCARPAITRSVTGTILVVNYDDYNPDFPGQLRSYPCWTNRGLGFYPMFSPIMGYDHEKKWLIAGGTIRTFLFDSAPVKKVDIGQCADGSSPITTMISYDDALAIADATFPDGVTKIVSSWVGVTHSRLYGFSRYVDDGAFTFKAWSVDYDGEDYVEEFTIDSGETSGTPSSMDVMDGSILTLGDNGSDGTIIEDGSAAEVLDGFSGDTAVSVVRVGGTYLWCEPNGLHSGSDTVEFAPLEMVFGEPTTVTYKAYALGWDELHRAAVVHWLPFSGWGGGGSPKAPQGYVTYIKESVTGGNIIGQAGVDIYLGYVANYGWPSGTGGGFVENDAPPEAAVIIPGKLPTPLTVTEGVLPDPPDPPPDCGLFLDCDTETQCFFLMYGDDLGAHAGATLINHSIDGYFATTSEHNFLDIEGIRATLDDVALLTDGIIPEDGGRPLGGTPSSTSGSKLYWAPFGTWNDYSDPGIKVSTTTFDHISPDADPTTFHWERYLTGVLVVVRCISGVGAVADMFFEWSDYAGRVSADDPAYAWPPTTPIESSYSSPFVQEDADDLLEGGVPSDCRMSSMLAQWHYEELDTTIDGDRRIYVFAIVGPLA